MENSKKKTRFKHVKKFFFSFVSFGKSMVISLKLIFTHPVDACIAVY